MNTFMIVMDEDIETVDAHGVAETIKHMIGRVLCFFEQGERVLVKERGVITNINLLSVLLVEIRRIRLRLLWII
jgi:hypothetical protein